MPLEFILFSGILSRSWLYVVLLVQQAIYKLVFLNNLVHEWTVICEGDLFFLCCVCVGVTFVFLCFRYYFFSLVYEYFVMENHYF